MGKINIYKWRPGLVSNQFRYNSQVLTETGWQPTPDLPPIARERVMAVRDLAKEAENEREVMDMIAGLWSLLPEAARKLPPATLQAMMDRTAAEADWKALKLAPFAPVGQEYVGAKDQIMATGQRHVEWLLTQFQPQWKARFFFGGMVLAIISGLRPEYNDRGDWGLHFVFGGWLELAGDMGDEAGALKEQLDVTFGIGQYDPLDMEATSAGARVAREWN